MNTDPKLYLDDLSNMGFDFYNIDDQNKSIAKISSESILKRL